ncbi:sulfatase-like hydrolase/transferase [Haloferula chungangensis]|uniref:Sulfatase-like hydrolase/transferase n=1 Tax=Haloferula chungangensis TaxID=1048331 RepID=A0ABW2L7J1_9BACT
MIIRLLLALTLTAVAHDIGGSTHSHPASPKINKPRIEDTIRANVYADNWFVLYINGQLATADPIPFIPHNVVSVDLLPEYPMTIAVMARDNAHPDTGMEYDNSNIGDGGFILKFADGTVTNSSWKAKDFFHGPINADTANPKVRAAPLPENWFAIDFDDSSWPQAKEYTEQQIDPKKPFFEHDFGGAKWIWSDDLQLDNTVIFRTRIDAPPNGKPATSDWPRGHIIPSATAAPAVIDASTSRTPIPTKGFAHRLDPSTPYQAKAFAPFAESLQIKWDENFVYIGTNAFPDHPMMEGITAWNQQVPLPQHFFGENAWRLPLHPTPAKNPVSSRTSLFKGAIAVAINGVPIFNPIKQDGRTDTNLAGELDEFGGHAGRADDYHYHLPPTFLNKLVGDKQPIGFAMDGYPLFGFKEADGSTPNKLDEFNGHDHGELGYHYHSSSSYPYLNGGLRGEAEIRDDQVANQPTTRGIRPYTQPLRGATVTGFERISDEHFKLDYQLDGKTHRIDYTLKRDGGADFEFTSPDGTVTEESHEARKNVGGGRKPRPDRESEQAGDQARTPWILVHASEIDANKDGSLTLTELLDEARKVFVGYDSDKNGQLSESEMREGRPTQRSALNGFVKEHHLEMDRDHDKQVSAVEMADQFRRFIQKHDINQDEQLTPDELKVEGEINPRFPATTALQTPRKDEAGSISPGTERPNIIFILIDDMGWNDVGFAGNRITQTPSIDQLARSGVTFTNAYSSAPNCAPTRACFISGQYPQRHGIYTVVDDRHAPGSAHHKMLATTSKAELSTETITIAEQFKANGYATAMFGMWNLGRGSNNPVSPEGQGFDLFEQPKSLGFEKDRYFNDKGEYLTDRFTDEAIAFIERKSGDPFFVYLAYHAVHAPFEPKPELVEKYKKLKAPDPEYAATVEAVDQNLGRLTAALERLKLDDHTIIVFTSDNGGNRRSTAPLRSGKGSLYEGGIRVPAAISGPGIAKGIRCEAPILSMDFYPTLLDLAGIKPATDHHLDGISFASTLHGGSAPTRDAVFWHFPSYIGGGGPSSAVRMGDFKLIQLFEDRTIEVYNLRTDPGETTNLAERDKEKTQQLLAALQTWQQETKAPLVTEANPAYDPTVVPPKGRDQRGKGKSRESRIQK